MPREHAPFREKGRSAGRTALAAGALGIVGALGVAGAGAMAALWRRTAGVCRRDGQPPGAMPPNADGTYKKSYGDRIELLMVGDAIAAGFGAQDARGTLGARLAKGLAKRTGRAVRLKTVAEVGSETWMLAEQQLPGLLPSYRPDVAVVIVGGSDVTRRIPLGDSTAALAEVIQDLRERGAQVVVGTCPDLGGLRPLPQPLRSLGARAFRQLAAAQADTAIGEGAYVVSLAGVLGPFFRPGWVRLVGADRLHANGTGYKRTARALLPSLLAALGVADEVPFGHLSPTGE